MSNLQVETALMVSATLRIEKALVSDMPGVAATELLSDYQTLKNENERMAFVAALSMYASIVGRRRQYISKDVISEEMTRGTSDHSSEIPSQLLLVMRENSRALDQITNKSRDSNLPRQT